MIVIQPQPYGSAPSHFPMMNEPSQLHTTSWDTASRRTHGSALGGEPGAGWDDPPRVLGGGDSRSAGGLRQMRTARDFTIVGEENIEDENRNALV